MAKVAKDARKAADPPLARADSLRRRAGVGSSFPITGYDDLTASQIGTRLTDLSRPDLRKVRTYENNNKARKSVLDKIESSSPETADERRFPGPATMGG